MFSWTATVLIRYYNSDFRDSGPTQIVSLNVIYYKRRSHYMTSFYVNAMPDMYKPLVNQDLKSHWTNFSL